MENVIHIDTTPNRGRIKSTGPGEVIDFTVPQIRKRESEAQDEWAKELVKAIEASQSTWKANQVSVKDMEIRFLEQLKQDLKEYTIELETIQEQMNNTTSIIDRKVLWRHMKIIQDKMDAARRGIEIKRKNIERLDF